MGRIEGLTQSVSYYLRGLLLQGATYEKIQSEFSVTPKQIEDVIASFSEEEKIEHQASLSRKSDACNTDDLSDLAISDHDTSLESNFGEQTKMLNSPDIKCETEEIGWRSIDARESDDALGEDVDEQLKNAIDEAKRVEKSIISHEQNRQENLFRFIARVYLISMASQRNSELHQSILKKSGVMPQNNTPHHKQVLRSILTLSKVKLPKQTEHEGCLVLEGLEESGVAEQEAAVMDFFTGSAGINQKATRGFARAKAARLSSERLRSLRKNRQNEINSNMETTKDNLITEARMRPLGKISANDEDVEWVDDLQLLLCDGQDILIRLHVLPEQLRAIVIKHGVRR